VLDWEIYQALLTVISCVDFVASTGRTGCSCATLKRMQNESATVLQSWPTGTVDKEEPLSTVPVCEPRIKNRHLPNGGHGS
jgi:hypothetical protein